jgi:riboflavin synthase
MELYTMFTGLIQGLGHVVEWQNGQAMAADTPPDTAGKDLLLQLPGTADFKLPAGASLAVNGCCLTLTAVITSPDAPAVFSLSPETLEKTALGALQPGDPVNLEPALSLGTPLGGHMVSGHVDATAELIQIKPYGNSTILRFRVQQPDKMVLLVEKGSVAVDGISLTINTVIQDVFSVAIIPHTWQHTNLKNRREGDRVNIETDLIGRYVHHFYAVGRIPSLYEQQAAANANSSSIPLPGGNMRVGEWFNGAPC